MNQPSADDYAARRQAALDTLKQFGLIPNPDAPENLMNLEFAADLARAVGPGGQVFNSSIMYEPNLED